MALRAYTASGTPRGLKPAALPGYGEAAGRIGQRAVLSAWTALMAGLAGCAGSGKPPVLDPSPERLMRRVADAVIVDYPKPPPFDWGESVLMTGMMRAGAVLNEPRYIAFVKTWADHWRRRGIGPILEGTPEAAMRAYCGHWGPGFPLLLLTERTGDKSYQAMAEQIVEFTLTRATRTRDGGFGHWGGNDQLWVDTLYMVCPLFSQLGRLAARPALYDEALQQLDIFSQHMQDPRTGLFTHMYDEPSGKNVGVLWGRGNGWAAMSYVEVLRHPVPDSPPLREARGKFRRLMNGLLAVRDLRSHLWHTVLDRPETCIETSASAMILASVVQAQQLGLLRVNDPQLVPRTWAALATRVDDEDRVFDVSSGTAPGAFETYATKLLGTYPWGTGGFLLAASAVHEAARTVRGTTGPASRRTPA